MATAEEFVIRLYVGAGHAPFEATRLARTYLVEHDISAAGLDASTVAFTVFGVPIVRAAEGAALPGSPAATEAEAEAIAEASGGLVEAQEVRAYGLTPEAAAGLVTYRNQAIAGGDAIPPTVTPGTGNLPLVDAEALAELERNGLLDAFL